MMTMRIQRTTAAGVTYQSSFKKPPSKKTLAALDAIAEAAIKHLALKEYAEPTEPEPSAEQKPD